MKKLNDSPELIIVAFALVFAAVLMAAQLFYTPSLETEKVVYIDKTAQLSETSARSEQAPEASVTEENNGEAEGAEETDAEAPAGVAAGKVNINTADLDTLCTLNGVGEVKAQRIIDYRTANGGFKSIEEIKNVSGIGDKTYENIKDSITV